MLSVYIGKHEDEIYNPPIYFNNTYEDEWITDEFSKKMILDVDKSTVLSPHIIESPVMGAITPKDLSGGVKTLMLMAFCQEENVIFNGTACGDNCAKWILEIAKKKDLTITLHHSMRFGPGPYEIRILNNGEIVHNFKEWVDTVWQFLRP